MDFDTLTMSTFIPLGFYTLCWCDSPTIPLTLTPHTEKVHMCNIILILLGVWLTIPGHSTYIYALLNFSSSDTPSLLLGNTLFFPLELWLHMLKAVLPQQKPSSFCLISDISSWISLSPRCFPTFLNLFGLCYYVLVYCWFLSPTPSSFSISLPLSLSFF